MSRLASRSRTCGCDRVAATARDVKTLGPLVQRYGDRVAGVLLTGYLDDGVAGLQEIQRNCGLSIVQDPNEATYPEMPRNALLAFQPDHCLPLEQIERLLAHLPNSAFGGRTMKVKKRAAKSSRSRDRIAVEPTAGPLAALACPECHGPLWQIPEGKLTRYQCLVGHRYSLVSLVAAHSEELESALWIALRVLEERIALQRRLASEVGTTREILVESGSQGRTEHYFPVAVSGGTPGKVRRLTISAHDGARLIAI